MKNRKLEFVIIGCGNLAWHLAKKITKSKTHSLSIHNHQNNSSLQQFSDKYNCDVFSNLNKISTTADYYFICVSDKAINAVAKKLKPSKPNALLMHTSGSQPLNKLGSKQNNLAVFYPLQTFTKQDKINWSHVPIIVEGGNEKALNEVIEISKLFSPKVVCLNYQERLQLHLAAVLVNNFTNALYVEAFKLLPKVNEQNHNLLLPLMEQSVKKIEKVHPLNAQTGPAKRKDVEVLGKHLKLIEKNTLLKNVYQLMTQLILLQQKNKA